MTTDYDFNGEVWNSKVSKKAIKFIERLIEPNLKLRMTVEQALEHPWIAEEDESPVLQKDLKANLNSMVFLRLANFSTTKLLQVEILLVFVKQILKDNDLQENRDAF